MNTLSLLHTYYSWHLQLWSFFLFCPHFSSLLPLEFYVANAKKAATVVTIPPVINFAPALVDGLGALVVGLLALGPMVGAEEGGPTSEGQASPK